MKVSTPNQIIQLEFNELSPVLMDRFISEGHLPNFARLQSEAHVFVTEAAEMAPNLEPWIQWITVHTGLNYDQHGIFDLGDGHKLDCPRIWDLVGEQGGRVLIFGSMNASFRQPIQGYILPDPWSTGITPYPPGEFEAFFDFIRANVHEHTRDRLPVSKYNQLRFFGFMMAHGMSFDTARTIATQLMSEKGSQNRWKRAVILDRLMWDVFARYWRKYEPQFSTFFLNSTAHFQHMYWRNMEPEAFGKKPSPEEQKEYQSAILFGYRSMDELVGKCLALASETTTIVLATGLSQQPCLKYENTGGKVFYRANDPDKLFRFAGISSNVRYAPVMSEQFRLHLPSEAEADDAVSKLLSLKLDGKPVMSARREANEVFGGCRMFETVKSVAVVVNDRGAQAKFYELFYNCNLVKSGMHHPDGILWIRTPDRHHSHEQRIALDRVAPTVLALAGVPQPSFIKAQPLSVGMSASPPAFASSHDRS